MVPGRHTWYGRVSGLVMQIHDSTVGVNVLCEQNKGREVAYHPAKLIKEGCLTEHLANSLNVGWTRREIKNFNDIDNYGKIGLHIVLFSCLVISKPLEFFGKQTRESLKLFWNAESTHRWYGIQIHYEFRLRTTTARILPRLIGNYHLGG